MSTYYQWAEGRPLPIRGDIAAGEIPAHDDATVTGIREALRARKAARLGLPPLLGVDWDDTRLMTSTDANIPGWPLLGKHVSYWPPLPLLVNHDPATARRHDKCSSEQCPNCGLGGLWESPAGCYQCGP